MVPPIEDLASGFHEICLPYFSELVRQSVVTMLAMLTAWTRHGLVSSSLKNEEPLSKTFKVWLLKPPVQKKIHHTF